MIMNFTRSKWTSRDPNEPHEYHDDFRGVASLRERRWMSWRYRPVRDWNRESRDHLKIQDWSRDSHNDHVIRDLQGRSWESRRITTFRTFRESPRERLSAQEGRQVVEKTQLENRLFWLPKRSERSGTNLSFCWCVLPLNRKIWGCGPGIPTQTYQEIWQVLSS